MGIQQYYLYHMLTGQTIIVNENSSMSVEFFKENILNTLPNQTWKGITKISIMQYIEPGSENKLFYQVHETQGIYFPTSHQVQIKAMDIDSMRKNMAHEAAHQYWYDEMTNAQRIKYTNLFLQTQKWSSAYAMTSDIEDFAETVSPIVAYNSVITDQAKIDFIQQHYLKPLNLNYSITKSPLGNWFLVNKNQ